MPVFLVLSPITQINCSFILLLLHSWVTPLVTKVTSVLTQMVKSLCPKMLSLMKRLFYMLLKFILGLFLLALYHFLLTFPLSMLLKNPLLLIFPVSLIHPMNPILCFVPLIMKLVMCLFLQLFLIH